MTAALLLLFLAPSPPMIDPAPLAADVSIAGIYSVHGDFAGSATIRQSPNGPWMVQWATGKMLTNPDGREQLGLTATLGIGIRTGDTLSVAWSDGRGPALTVYTIRGRVLQGRWTAGGALQNEELRWVAKVPD